MWVVDSPRPGDLLHSAQPPADGLPPDEACDSLIDQAGCGLVGRIVLSEAQHDRRRERWSMSNAYPMLTLGPPKWFFCEPSDPWPAASLAGISDHVNCTAFALLD